MTFNDAIEQIPNLITSAAESNPATGYLLIGLIMLIENLIPPIPSEVVMPLAGFLVQQGKIELIPAVLSGLFGSVLGAWFWYRVGRTVNEEKLEHWLEKRGSWLGLRPSDLSRSRRWFNRHGAALVFWGRLVPGVRTLISVPAGIEMMPQKSFLLWTTAGSLAWIILLTVSGQALGFGYQKISTWIEPIADLVKVVLAIAAVAGAGWLLLRLIRKLR